MRSGTEVEGLPRAAVGLSSGGGQAHFDDMADAAERRVAIACDALIRGTPPDYRGLPQSQQLALSNKHLYAVFRFNRGDEAEHLAAAREAVREGLERRGIW